MGGAEIWHSDGGGQNDIIRVTLTRTTYISRATAAAFAINIVAERLTALCTEHFAHEESENLWRSLHVIISFGRQKLFV